MSQAIAQAAGAESAARESVGSNPRTIEEAVREFLRHVSPWILIVCFSIALGARIRVGNWSLWDLLPVAALLAYWPIQEWLIHVFILHFKPIRVGRFTIDFRIPRKHREHHRNPWDIPLVFIPLNGFLYIIPLSVVLAFWLTPTPALALTGITAAFGLTIHYEWVHFIVHTRYTPRSRYYQRLWRNHRLHHFKNEHYWYGVTRLQGDTMLRTAPVPASVPPSPTARTLGVDAPS
jgi:hypothetical protein